MRRDAVYLAALEKSLVKNCQSSDLGNVYGFHSWGLKNKSRFLLKAHYVAVILFFFAAGLIGIGMAFYCSGSHPWKGYLFVAEKVITILFVGCILILAWKAKGINDWPVGEAFPKEILK